MSLESVRAFLAENAPEIDILESPTSSATVALAAAAFGVLPAEIAKTLGLRMGERVFLVVTRGDARLDNRKARETFGGKVKMIDLSEVEAITGHPVGGVCPFGLVQKLDVYCDVSLRDFDIVVPAAGSITTAVKISPERMAEITGAAWVDVCQTPPAEIP
ncbi:MAG: YbaK/EbsC family protein [Acetobacteraceae bacterium]|nr:YbaK/EbsC family protein [Acetobacteraceae bacterium]